MNEFAVSAPIVTIHYQCVYVKRGLCKQTRGVTCIEWLSPVIIRRFGPQAIVNYHIQWHYDISFERPNQWDIPFKRADLNLLHKMQVVFRNVEYIWHEDQVFLYCMKCTLTKDNTVEQFYWFTEFDHHICSLWMFSFCRGRCKSHSRMRRSPESLSLQPKG